MSGPGGIPAAPPAAPPFRNLRVWARSFDLALEIMRLARGAASAESRAHARRMADCASQVPVAIARGESAGSAGEFTRCLQAALSDLSEMETHLLLCAETRELGEADVSRCLERSQEVRRMLRALILKLRTPAGAPAGPAAFQRGSALVVAILASALLGALGLSILQIADTESRISSRARDREALLNVAETGARAVKRWFDQPVSGDPSDPSRLRHRFLGTFDLRDPVEFDRSRRRIDHDGNPSTPEVVADGSPGREFYRQGRSAWPGSPALDLFGVPFRGGLADAAMGPEEAPDLVLEDRPGVVDRLDQMNASLFLDQERTGRIERIEIYRPSLAGTAAGAPRLGIASVRVTAALYRRLDRIGSTPVVPAGALPHGRATVRMGLAAIPFTAPRGPLESCGDLEAGGRMRAAWGRVIALGDVILPDRMDRLDGMVPSAFPYASFARRIAGPLPGGDLHDWLSDADESVEDPWLKIVAGGDLVGWSTLPDQPFPYSSARSIDTDHSNLFQRVAGLTCPAFDYGLWKSIALSSPAGDRHLRYFAFDPGTGLFREHGAGPARSVRDWTHGEEGLFFFDTLDGLPPAPANLTPPVTITGGDWSTAGLIYLNAVRFEAGASRGVERALLPPGEPFDDADLDAAHDPAEPFVNLHYATSVTPGAPFAQMLKRPGAAQASDIESPDGERYLVSTTPGRDRSGPPLLAEVNLFGVLFNAGEIVAEGDSVTFGSLIGGRGVVQRTPGADTPFIWFDERLNSGAWPPPEIAMPRTWIRWWQTSRP